MRRILKAALSLAAALSCLVSAFAQNEDNSTIEEEYIGQSCTSIMVGKKASADGSVITSHTCDGSYRTWVYMEPAEDHPRGAMHPVYKGTMHTAYRGDMTGVTLAGLIPEAEHTYAYLNSAYPSMNEKQLAMGETTFTGPDTLINSNGMFLIEELERVALQRCDNARDAIRLMGQLAQKYGYGDGGECLTVADKNEVWQFEITGCGKDKIGAVWVAARVPDDEVAVSANIPRVGRIDRSNKDYFMCSDNVEKVALEYGLWDGKGEFVFWKAYNCDYSKGKNFLEREFFILNSFAPSLGLSMDMDELPFSVKPEKKVAVRDVTALLRSTYEGTDMDMTQNVKMNEKRVSPVANPWLTTAMKNTLNYISPGVVESRRTVSVAWCAYSHVTQLRDWLPDEIGGVCWFSLDNPGQSPRVPFFCGSKTLPVEYYRCGQKSYSPYIALWKFRQANKLATLQWQSTKDGFMKNVIEMEDMAFDGIKALESNHSSEQLDAYTQKIFSAACDKWQEMENSYWVRFGNGF